MSKVTDFVKGILDGRSGEEAFASISDLGFLSKPEMEYFAKGADQFQFFVLRPDAIKGLTDKAVNKNAAQLIADKFFGGPVSESFAATFKDKDRGSFSFNNPAINKGIIDFVVGNLGLTTDHKGLFGSVYVGARYDGKEIFIKGPDDKVVHLETYGKEGQEEVVAIATNDAVLASKDDVAKVAIDGHHATGEEEFCAAFGARVLPDGGAKLVTSEFKVENDNLEDSAIIVRSDEVCFYDESGKQIDASASEQPVQVPYETSGHGVVVSNESNNAVNSLVINMPINDIGKNVAPVQPAQE